MAHALAGIAVWHAIAQHELDASPCSCLEAQAEPSASRQARFWARSLSPCSCDPLEWLASIGAWCPFPPLDAMAPLAMPQPVLVTEKASTVRRIIKGRSERIIAGRRIWTSPGMASANLVATGEGRWMRPKDHKNVDTKRSRTPGAHCKLIRRRPRFCGDLVAIASPANCLERRKDQAVGRLIRYCAARKRVFRAANEKLHRVYVP